MLHYLEMRQIGILFSLQLECVWKGHLEFERQMEVDNEANQSNFEEYTHYFSNLHGIAQFVH